MKNNSQSWFNPKLISRADGEIEDAVFASVNIKKGDNGWIMGSVTI